MRRQTLVPLAGPLFWDGFHEVPLQLTDTGMMLEQVLLRFIELLYGGKSRGEKTVWKGGGGARKFKRQVEQESNKERRNNR